MWPRLTSILEHLYLTTGNHFHDAMARSRDLLLCFFFAQALSYAEDLSTHPYEAKERLGRLFNMIDASHDGEVDVNELVTWINAVFRQVSNIQITHNIILLPNCALSRADKRAAREMLQRQDTNNDGYVSMAEYMDENFGYTLQEIEAIRKDSSTESRQILESVDDEMERFARADVNGDGQLDVEELVAFNSPHHHGHMAAYVVSEVLRHQDYNGDGRLHLEEYLADSKDVEVLEYEKERFADIDKNGDGYADTDELRLHYLEEAEKYARREAENLMAESDVNSDGRLTQAEVSEAYEAWLDSPATEHGELLQDMKMYQLTQHGGLRDEL
ncbi:unnamed protein product [Hydatigera taeniaeformis]|uniref:Reticulocalbin-2 n=1 Tax=Hydatigena taeniaeformis TaxID=6205 RepID=A0A0R3X2R5_HYDTA|nr:unnamed protein product [Hydatigera taeniaeformis]